MFFRYIVIKVGRRVTDLGIRIRHLLRKCRE